MHSVLVGWSYSNWLQWAMASLHGLLLKIPSYVDMGLYSSLSAGNQESPKRYSMVVLTVLTKQIHPQCCLGQVSGVTAGMTVARWVWPKPGWTVQLFRSHRELFCGCFPASIWIEWSSWGPFTCRQCPVDSSLIWGAAWVLLDCCSSDYLRCRTVSGRGCRQWTLGIPAVKIQRTNII